MSEPKKHHYLSQFYLSRFTLSDTNEGELFCYDINNNSFRQSKPKNEGYVKYFNKIESNPANPNVLEKELSKIEGSISDLLKLIHETKTLPSTPDLNELLYFLALLGVRNPALRDNFHEFQERVTSTMFELMMSNKKIWDVELNRINAESNDKFKNISYEEMKDFIKGKRWRLIESNENIIKREFRSVDHVYKLLHKRSWLLLVNESNEDYFVTSDRPVKLVPDKLDDFKFGVGFSNRNVKLYFPLSRSLLMMGVFGNQTASIPINREMIATLNTLQYFYTSRYIYSPVADFVMLGNGGSIISARSFNNGSSGNTTKTQSLPV